MTKPRELEVIERQNAKALIAKLKSGNPLTPKQIEQISRVIELDSTPVKKTTIDSIKKKDNEVLKKITLKKILTPLQLAHLKQRLDNDPFIEKAKPQPAKIPKTVSVKSLASLLDMTDRNVQSLYQAGHVVKSERGTYLLKESIKKYLQFLKKSNANTDVEKAVDYQESKARREAANAEKIELQVMVMKGELLNTEIVEIWASSMIAAFKNNLLGIPSKVAPILEGQPKAEIFKILTDEIKQKLDDLSDPDTTKLVEETERKSIEAHEASIDAESQRVGG